MLVGHATTQHGLVIMGRLDCKKASQIFASACLPFPLLFTAITAATTTTLLLKLNLNLLLPAARALLRFFVFLLRPSPLQAASAVAGVLEQLLLYRVRADPFPLHLLFFSSSKIIVRLLVWAMNQSRSNLVVWSTIYISRKKRKNKGVMLLLVWTME